MVTVMALARESVTEMALKKETARERVLEERAQEKAMEMVQATEMARARDKPMAQRKKGLESMIPKYTTSKTKMT
jgi:hypothetical protein